jgi:cytoplasmic iron level regulating protein YaaA (DUF328/UPF0246 family)
MIAIISPAKRLDFDNRVDFKPTEVRFKKETKSLIETLRQKSEKEVQTLMSLSDRLANLNLERYQQFQTDATPKDAKQALFAFQGDVYQGMQADTFDKNDVDYAQQHLRMLSGLYGILRPLDMIQPYRLEMGTKLSINGHDTLYSFWGDKIAKALQKDLQEQGDDIIINLASNEYFKAVDTKAMEARIVDVDFKEVKAGKYKTVAIYAKKARGMMAHFMIKNKISNPQHLQGFDYDGYTFNDSISEGNKLVFTRG